MQEVSATNTTADRFDQLKTSALVDSSSQASAFSDFLNILSSQSKDTSLLDTATGTDAAQHDLTPYRDAAQRVDTSNGISTLAHAPAPATVRDRDAPKTEDAPGTTTQDDADGTDAPQTAAAETASKGSAQTKEAKSKRTNANETTDSTSQANSAAGQVGLANRNTPVTRESFEEAKPLLAKAGLSDREIEALSSKVQAGTLTWGQLVQTLGSHMSGGKRSVQLGADEALNLQAMFQKLGFGQDAAGKLVRSVEAGDGQNVLAAVLSKLDKMDADSSPGLDGDELRAFFKALRVPQATADKLVASLGDNATAAQLKNALAQGAQAVRAQFAETSSSDAKLIKSLGALMKKDADKAGRDAQATTGKNSRDSGGPKVAFELKTKGKDDTSFFDQHEKTQEKKESDDSWNHFLDKVRSSDSGTQNNGAANQRTSASDGGTQVQNALKDALGEVRSATSLAGQGTAAQSKAEASRQAKPYEKVLAPKALNQVTEALLKNLGDGRKQLNLSLEPDSLGKVQVMLQVKGKEITAVLHAEHADTANMLTSQMQSIKKNLEDQGLTVQNLEVQSGLTSNQQQQQYSADEHNQAQEQQEMSHLMSRLRLLRSDGANVVQGVQGNAIQAIFADRGLHLIA